MVRLEVTSAPDENAEILYFNSKMVRLEGPECIHHPTREVNFNSKMVRLEDGTIKFIYRSVIFQFQNGTIRSGSVSPSFPLPQNW